MVRKQRALYWQAGVDLNFVHNLVEQASYFRGNDDHWYNAILVAQF